MEKQQPQSQSRYGQWIIGMMLVAYLSTSFDYRYFTLQSPMVTVGKRKIHKQDLIQKIREEKAQVELSFFGQRKPNSDALWIQRVAMNEMWDQEAEALGIEVSENRARESLREKMCFLDDSGRIHFQRLMKFYEKNPMFFQLDMQSEQEQGKGKLFRGNGEFLDPEDRFDNNKMKAFLRNHGLSLPQMIAAEQRALRRKALQKSLARNIFLPSFYKKMGVRGQNQIRSWNSWFFPVDLSQAAQREVSKESVELYLRNKMPEDRKNAPEMRTFTVMLTPNFATVSPSSRKKGEADMKTTIEDAIGSGKTLHEVAKDRGWTCVTLTSSILGRGMDFAPLGWGISEEFPGDRVDQRDETSSKENPSGEKNSGGTENSRKKISSESSQGQGHPSGRKKSLNLPKEVRAKIIERLFSSQEELFSMPVMMGGMVWVHVQHVEAPRPLNPRELYAAAEYALKVEKLQREVKDKATEFVKNIPHHGSKGGKNKETLGAMKTHSASTQDLSRPPEGVSAHTMMEVFSMTPPPKSTVIKVPGGYEVIQLTAITSTPKDGNPEGEKSTIEIQEKALEQEWAAAFLHAYGLSLSKKHHIIWNNQALRDGFGSEVMEDSGGEEEEE